MLPMRDMDVYAVLASALRRRRLSVQTEVIEWLENSAVMRWRGYLWIPGRARVEKRCVVCNAVTTPGFWSWRPLTDDQNRGARVCFNCAADMYGES